MATKKRSAGAFDIRNVIGLLFAIYGVILVLSALFLDPGVNLDTGAAKESSFNLWTGVAMLVVAGCMIAWALLRPIVVEEAAE